MSLDMAEDPKILMKQRESIVLILDSGDYNGHVPSIEDQWAALGLFATLTARIYISLGFWEATTNGS